MNDQLFESIAPPPGGLETLRVRLLQDAASRARRRRVGTVALVLLLALVGPLLWRASRTPLPAAVNLTAAYHPGLVRLGLAPAPTEPLEIPPSMRHIMAARRVPLDSKRVIFYQIASAAPAESSAATTHSDGFRLQ